MVPAGQPGGPASEHEQPPLPGTSDDGPGGPPEPPPGSPGERPGSVIPAGQPGGPASEHEQPPLPGTSDDGPGGPPEPPPGSPGEPGSVIPAGQPEGRLPTPVLTEHDLGHGDPGNVIRPVSRAVRRLPGGDAASASFPPVSLAAISPSGVACRE